MMPPKLQLLAVVAFAVAMLFLENQIQKLEESRWKLERAIARHEVEKLNSDIQWMALSKTPLQMKKKIE